MLRKILDRNLGILSIGRTEARYFAHGERDATPKESRVVIFVHCAFSDGRSGCNRAVPRVNCCIGGTHERPDKRFAVATPVTAEDS